MPLIVLGNMHPFSAAKVPQLQELVVSLVYNNNYWTSRRRLGGPFTKTLA